MMYKYKINYGGNSFENNNSLNNQKQWGFGVEQEFPIFIKPSDVDRENLHEMQLLFKKYDTDTNIFEFNLYNLQKILQYKNKKSFYFIYFSDYDTINILENYLKSKKKNRILLGKNNNKKEFLQESSEKMPIIIDLIRKFESLPNKTILSTIIILNNIYNFYKTFIKKYIYDPDFFKVQEYFIKEVDNNNDINIKISYNEKYIQINNIIYNLGRKLDLDSGGFEIDSGGFEIRSDNFEKVTVKQVIEELNNKKKVIKESLKEKFSLEDDNIIFMDKETMYYDEDDKNYKYSGEPEINITLPYVFPNTDVEEFKKQHINLMKCLQYLSPLFLASFTGSYPKSFGDNHENFETSYRFKNGSRILVTDVNNIYNDGKADYDSTHDTIQDIYLNHFNIRDLALELNSPYQIEFSVNRNDIKFNPQKGKFFGFEWKIIDQFPIEYLNNITLLVVMLAQYLKDYKIKIDEDPRETFKVSHSVLTQYLDKSIVSDEIWPYKLLENIIFEGWNVCMSNHLHYVKLLKEKLNLDKNNINLDDNKTAFDLLNSLHHSLFNHYKSEGTKTDIIDCFFTNFKNSEEYTELYYLPNINLRSFNNMIDLMKENDEKKEFNSLEEQVKNDETNEDHEDYKYYEN